MADPLNRDAAAIADRAGQLADEAQRLAAEASDLAHRAAQADAPATDPLLFGLTVFALACFVGYYVVWKVTPALHAPLMSVANAISGVVVLGAMIAAGPAIFGISKILGFVAVVLASVNIFGGFIITQRMLQMFRKKDG